MGTAKSKTKRISANDTVKITAIILTYDAHHVFAKHVLIRYRNWWPRSPFKFYLPYNGEKPSLTKFEALGMDIRAVHTRTSISDTVLTLLKACCKPEQLVFFLLD